MADDLTPSDPAGEERDKDREVDPGEPIAVLAGLERTPSPSFFNIVRRRIQRRSTASQLASFSWNVPTMIFMEFWKAVIQILSPRDTSKGGQA